MIYYNFTYLEIDKNIKTYNIIKFLISKSQYDKLFSSTTIILLLLISIFSLERKKFYKIKSLESGIKLKINLIKKKF